jgi:predicted Zn-ribbon and HTH transcriptional regulator
MTTSETGPAAPVPERPRHEVAEVFRLHGDAYRQTHRLSTPALRVMHAIDTCRTAALGGHLERCTDCGFERPAYNSCRNRHCPTCQSLAKARWLKARQAELLPVDSFHTVFTVPHDLNALMLANKAGL